MRVVLGVAVAVVLAAAAAAVVLRRPAPDVPVPSAGVVVDPEIAADVEAAAAAVRAAPGDAGAWAELAMIYDANVMPVPAAACYREALARRPDTAEWWYHLATVLERTDRFDESSAALRRAAELAPRYAPMHVAAALWALQRGKLAEAEDEARRAMTTSGEAPDALLVLGRVQLQGGRDADAASTLARALASWPKEWSDGAYPRMLLGTALVRLGRDDEAAPLLANGVVDPPPLPDPWRDAVARRRGGAPAQIAWGVRLVEAGRLREATALFEDVRRRRPDNVGAGLELGTAYLLAGRADDAVDVLRATAKAHPNHPEATARLVSALWAAGRGAESLTEADAALARTPQSVDLLLARGGVLTEADRADAALADFEAVVRLAPSNTAARASEGVALLRLGRTDAAQTAFDEALRRNSGETTAIAGMALVALRRGDVASADAWLAKIVRVPPRLVRIVDEARSARAAAR
jgi:tetratricopeptide (TPR) repeat protein